MKTYRLSPQYFENNRRSAINIYLFLYILVVIFIFNLTSNKISHSLQTLLGTITIVFLFIFGTLLYIALANNMISHNQKNFHTYQLTIDGDVLTKTQEGYPDISISASHITKLTEFSNRFLIIYTDTKKNRISIPYLLEDYPDLRSTLDQWHTIQEIKSGIGIKLAVVGFVISFSAIFIVPLFSRSPIAQIIMSVLLLFYSLFMFIVFRSSNDFPKTARRYSWYFLLLAGVAIILIFMGLKDWTN